MTGNPEANELIGSSAVNFQNLAKTMPQLKQHPFYQMAMMQLKEGMEKANIPWIDVI